MGLDLGSIGDMAGKAKDMAAVPKLWEDVKGKDWEDFHERIQTARDQHEAEPEQLDQVEQASHHAQYSGKEFPDSLPGLMNTLKDHMPNNG